MTTEYHGCVWLVPESTNLPNESLVDAVICYATGDDLLLYEPSVATFELYQSLMKQPHETLERLFWDMEYMSPQQMLNCIHELINE